MSHGKMYCGCVHSQYLCLTAGWELSFMFLFLYARVYACDRFLRFTVIVRRNAYRLSFVSPLLVSNAVKLIHSFDGTNKKNTHTKLAFLWIQPMIFFNSNNNLNTPWNFSLIGFICYAQVRFFFLHRIHPTDSTTPNNITHRLPQSSLNFIRSGRSFVRTFAQPLFLSSLPTLFFNLCIFL